MMYRARLPVLKLRGVLSGVTRRYELAFSKRCIVTITVLRYEIPCQQVPTRTKGGNDGTVFNERLVKFLVPVKMQ